VKPARHCYARPPSARLRRLPGGLQALSGGSVPKEMKHQELTAKIIECAYKVYNTLGYNNLQYSIINPNASPVTLNFEVKIAT